MIEPTRGHTPALSILLVIRREQAWLEEVAASILEQDYTDLEIVAVDDAASGHEPQLLDEIALRDSRVRVHHLTEPAGPGAARDRAIAEARGEYVWLVRPTDLLAPGALAAVVARIGDEHPDVVLVHHVIHDVVGKERPGPHRRVLERIARDGDDLFDHPEAAAHLGPPLWNKVLRRSQLAATGGGGAAAELTVAWPALLIAGRIDALPAVCYVRREVPRFDDRAAALDVPAAYDHVMTFAAARDDVPAGRRRAFPAAALAHELRLLRGLRGADRRRFFAAMSEVQRRHGSPATPAALERRLETRIVARDAYPALQALQGARAARAAARRGRGRLRRRAGRLKSTWRRRRLHRYYRSRLRKPIEPDLAVFASYWYRGYSCNPRAIYEKARELVPGFRGVWVVSRERAGDFPLDVPHVVAGTREYYDVIARARWFVNNVNFPNDLVKRPTSVHVMTHHGTPLKLMGLDERRSPVTRMDFRALMRRCARWDFSISSNAHSTLVWERVYPTRYETLEVGYPRNDVLVTATEDDVARIRSALGIDPGQVAVLYAPTHRDQEKRFVVPMDVGAVAQALGPDHVLLLRAHYFYDAASGVADGGQVRDVGGHPSIEELCLAADVLITDYSSILFDYAILDRPIVVHAPDWEAYRAIRGTYFDLLAEAPGVVTRTDAEVVGAFRSGAVFGEGARRARAVFRERFCALEDGRAAERVVRRVWLGELPQAAVQGRWSATARQ